MSDLDSAYSERAQLLALLAWEYDAVLGPAVDVDEPGWWILYLYACCSQLTWHIAPDDLHFFDGVRRVTADDWRAQWDGHTTEQKYARIALMVRFIRLRKQGRDYRDQSEAA